MNINNLKKNKNNYLKFVWPIDRIIIILNYINMVKKKNKYKIDIFNINML
jgi:hypothetical protein